MKKIAEKWYLVLIIGFLVFAALVFGIFGKGSIISVHDNLDLFVAQFQMLKNTGAFWKHGVEVPFLGGISRDVLPSEFSLYSLLYMILPSYYAYVAGYLLKIVIGTFSMVLLAKDLFKDQYGESKPVIFLAGFAYGILNVFPAFGIPFASVPLVVYLLRKIYRSPSAGWYLLLFLYPLLSYFSYFGLFILGYLAIAFVILWIRDRKFPFRMILSLIVLSAGYILFEYRLFGTMLFGSEETIRSTMEAGSFTGGEIVKTMVDGFRQGMFHAESIHTYLVMPVCLLYFLFLNVSYIRKGNMKGIFHDGYNLLMVLLVFNSVVYGIYYLEPFRSLIEKIVPPLKGWQFNRTIFFNPFVWYLAFLVVLVRLYQEKKKCLCVLTDLLAVAAVLLIVFSGTRYNDLYHTCVAKAYEILKGKESNDLSYGEFYSEELFAKAKEDIGYNGEWSAAYGFHPAILEYNGISTLDGYLGFYSQDYKDRFRKVIAPALSQNAASAEYFDTWGARAYLYSPTENSLVMAVRDYHVEDESLAIDVDAFKALSGRYLFSRICISNAEEEGFTLIGTYTDESSPYTLYVYRTTTLYQSNNWSEVPFAERDLTYDKDVIYETADHLEELAKEAVRQEENQETVVLQEEKALSLYESLLDGCIRVRTCNSLSQIRYDMDVRDEENASLQEQQYEDAVDITDRVYAAMAQICNSPYKEIFSEVFTESEISSIQDYEEMTEQEKDLILKENSLQQEYNEALLDDYDAEYEGKTWSFAMLETEEDSLAVEKYQAVQRALYEEKNSVIGEIYCELVSVRDQLAREYEYDNYAEYAYGGLYLRDYDTADAKALFKQVKKEVMPWLIEIESLYYEMDDSALEELNDSPAAERLSAVQKYIGELDPEMEEAFDHMLTYDLYDMDAGESKAQTGYTIELPWYGDAFIFDAPYGTCQDYVTTIHEFGHYNYAVHKKSNPLFVVNNMDLCEIHSQGLEMLFYDYDQDMIPGEAGDMFRLQDVVQLAEQTANACMLAEFEICVYENPDMTREEMNKLYCNLAREYGMAVNDQDIQELYSWVDIPHLFMQPCYYLGYGTSAFTSLDLFALAGEDREAAVDKYLELTAVSAETPYCEAVQKVGLRDIFEKGVPGEILKEVNNRLKKDYEQ